MEEENNPIGEGGATPMNVAKWAQVEVAQGLLPKEKIIVVEYKDAFDAVALQDSVDNGRPDNITAGSFMDFVYSKPSVDTSVGAITIHVFSPTNVPTSQVWIKMKSLGGLNCDLPKDYPADGKVVDAAAMNPKLLGVLGFPEAVVAPLTFQNVTIEGGPAFLATVIDSSKDATVILPTVTTPLKVPEAFARFRGHYYCKFLLTPPPSSAPSSK